MCLDFLDPPLERRRLSFRQKLGWRIRSAPVRGMSILPNKGAKCRLSVLIEILNRGVKDIFIAFVSWQQRKQVCADLKAIYAAATESEAEFNLELFAKKNWTSIIPRLASLGGLIDNILFPSLPTHLRFVR
jgi:hypothetical protein